MSSPGSTSRRWPRGPSWSICLTHSSLLLELLYPVLIWVKILRPLMLAGAFMLHVGIAVVSPGLAEFALAMLAANLAFVLRHLAAWPGHWRGPAGR